MYKPWAGTVGHHAGHAEIIEHQTLRIGASNPLIQLSYMMKSIKQMVFIVITPTQKELMGKFGELAFISIIKMMNINQFIR